MKNKIDSYPSVLFTAEIPEEFQKQLEGSGINVQVKPFITDEYPDAQEWIKTVTKGYDAWVFTSKRAVKAVAPVLDQLPVPPFVFAVGEKTAKKLHELSINAIIPDDEFNMKALSKKMNEYQLKKVVHFCGNRKSSNLNELLTIENVEVLSKEVYRTFLKPEEVETDHLDGIVFMSPSGVQAFLQKNSMPETLAVFSIGPSTTRALKKTTVKKITQAQPSTLESLIETIQKKLSGCPFLN